MSEPSVSFAEPESFDAGYNRKLELTALVAKIQNEFSSLNKDRQKYTFLQMENRKAELRNRLAANNEELRYIKGWLATKGQESRRERRKFFLEQGGTGRGTSLLKEATRAYTEVVHYVKSLEDEIIELRNENTALRDKLDSIEHGSTVAPGSSVDEWRDQD